MLKYEIDLKFTFENCLFLNWLSYDWLFCCAFLIIFQTEQRPVICVFNAVTGETLPIMGDEALLHITVARLKTMVSMQSGLPVSTFRLITPSGLQLYDCNQLHEYAIAVGMAYFLSVLRLTRSLCIDSSVFKHCVLSSYILFCYLSRSFLKLDLN